MHKFIVDEQSSRLRISLAIRNSQIHSELVVCHVEDYGNGAFHDGTRRMFQRTSNAHAR